MYIIDKNIHILLEDKKQTFLISASKIFTHDKKKNIEYFEKKYLICTLKNIINGISVKNINGIK